MANFAKYFGHQEAKNRPIFLKIKSGLVLAPRNNNINLQLDWLRNFGFIERKPSVTDDRQTSVNWLEYGQVSLVSAVCEY